VHLVGKDGNIVQKLLGVVVLAVAFMIGASTVGCSKKTPTSATKGPAVNKSITTETPDKTDKTAETATPEKTEKKVESTTKSAEKTEKKVESTTKTPGTEKSEKKTESTEKKKS
jgi:hypothetical protein